MKKTKYNQGFSILFIAVFIVVIVAGGYYIYSKYNIKTLNGNISTPVAQEPNIPMYCGYPDPFKLHIISTTGASGGMDIKTSDQSEYGQIANQMIGGLVSGLMSGKSYSEVWIEKTVTGRVIKLSKKYGIGGIISNTLSISLADSDAPSDVTLNLDYEKGTATCSKSSSLSKLKRDSVYIFDDGIFVSLKNLGKTVVYNQPDLVPYDSLPTRVINGIPCFYSEAMKGSYSCFSKQYCASIYSGGNFTINADVNTNTKGDNSVKVQGDISNGTINGTVNVSGGSKTSSLGSGSANSSVSTEVKSIDTNDFPDSVFDISGLDLSKCEDLDQMQKIASDYLAGKITSQQMSQKEKSSSTYVEFPISNLNIDNTSFINTAKAVLNTK